MHMFKRKKKVILITTKDLTEKDMIEDTLIEHSITYEAIMTNINQLYPFKQAIIGQALAGKDQPRYAWDIVIEEKDLTKAQKILGILD